MQEKWKMGSKYKPRAKDFESDDYDDYDAYDDFSFDFDDSTDSFKNLSRDIYSTEWEDPSDRISARRKIERRRELKELYSQFDDGDDLYVGDDW